MERREERPVLNPAVEESTMTVMTMILEAAEAAVVSDVLVVVVAALVALVEVGAASGTTVARVWV